MARQVAALFCLRWHAHLGQIDGVKHIGRAQLISPSDARHQVLDLLEAVALVLVVLLLEAVWQLGQACTKPQLSCCSSEGIQQVCCAVP